MSRIYDNWERLVAAALKKQQLWELFHEQSRSPSEATDFSASSSFSSPIHNVAIDVLSPGSSSKEGSAKLHAKLVCVSDFNPAFDIVFLASSELLGRGTFGSLYTAIIGNGMKIVVRRLKYGITSELDFERNMKIVGNVMHKNVVAPRAYYYSKDERLILYDYYSNGSLYALLHGRIGEKHADVDWEIRLRIAIGAAWGIAEIHTQNGGKLVHGNIKASNILINSQKYGCISDLGLANMAAIAFQPTAWCYAPEVENTQNISQTSDVYSFGILILELLTRKSSVYIRGGPQAVDLAKLVSSVKSKKWAAKVFDPDLLKHTQIKAQMVKMLQIGISCLAKSPKKRPKISSIVKMLVDIRVNSIGSIPSLRGKLVFVEDKNPSFDLEEMLGAGAEMLGNGTFGNCYKASFEDGITITVKRLWGVNVMFKEFEQHMEAIGGMRHENVAHELKAYYYSEVEKILVYDYHHQCSVSTLLNGRRDGGEASLEWLARLKIAVGAARGIAHIHRQGGQTFVHGNIKSTNIFLNGRSDGLISDVGLAKVVAPIRRSAMPTPGYCAPEVTNTGSVSQASDVYSFGVVLLELVTGKSYQHTGNDGEIVSLAKSIESMLRDEWTGDALDQEILTEENEKAMLQLLEIGMYCVTHEPGLRPKMPQVVEMLEEINEMSEEIWGVDTMDQPSVESRLEDLFQDLLSSLSSVIATPIVLSD